MFQHIKSLLTRIRKGSMAVNTQHTLPPEALEIVMYTRTMPCPFVSLAKRVFAEYHIPYREVFIDQDKQAEALLLQWTGFLSVPTIILARVGEDLPYSPPTELMPNSSPRGINRFTMITEPDESQLLAWVKYARLLPSTHS